MTAQHHAGEPTPDAPAARSLTWLVPAGLAVALVAVVGGLLLGRNTAAAARTTDEVSVGFLRDMGTHHAQAVRMAEVAHRRGADPTLVYLAFDILSTQQGQIGIMSTLLASADQAQSSTTPAMAWMGHSGPMPGLASEADIRALETLSVSAMEQSWLRLMVRHHRGAVPMADAAAADAGDPAVAVLAASMSASQQSEIDALQDMLRARGAAPEPETDPARHGAQSAGGAVGTPLVPPHDGH